MKTKSLFAVIASLALAAGVSAAAHAQTLTTDPVHTYNAPAAGITAQQCSHEGEVEVKEYEIPYTCGVPMTYRCSSCGRLFLRRDNGRWPHHPHQVPLN